MADLKRAGNRGLYADRATWINEGRAWVCPATGYPQSWTVFIPRSRNESVTVQVSSLAEAAQVADQRGVELTISARTYPYLVQQGFAPPERQDTLPFADARATDLRELDQQMALHQRAAGLLGLPAPVAAGTAGECGFVVRVITADTVALDSAWIVGRINLDLDATNTVIHVSAG
ncbi:hypothetical protein [Flexivirga caeni]|uniref:Uncharacterized protein n=1 Tax=Flexivirga caeni TaxID=2294115 RepID=A0A3M9LXC9_9MICO|nr:hypothetical protein [Flexivirga caeni]RNI17969.1 hypothetical protein EFY87_18890 [Flexivirga caeni]